MRLGAHLQGLSAQSWAKIRSWQKNRKTGENTVCAMLLVFIPTHIPLHNISRRFTTISMGSRMEECQPWGTVKCNSGCAKQVPSLPVIDYEVV